jgi:phosphotransferase system IIA component
VQLRSILWSYRRHYRIHSDSNRKVFLHLGVKFSGINGRFFSKCTYFGESQKDSNPVSSPKVLNFIE